MDGLNNWIHYIKNCGKLFLNWFNITIIYKLFIALVYMLANKKLMDKILKFIMTVPNHLI
jgi:hypothetical protein